MRFVKKPNILLVFSDQQRSTAMGCAGVEAVSTPAMDALARQGSRFTNAVSNTPVCSPARASLFTGLHVLTHGLVNNDIAIRTDVRSLAHCLNDAGYRCGYIGKWHLDCADRGVFVPPGPRRLGFDDYWAACNCNHAYFAAHYYLNNDPEPRWFDGYEPDTQTDLAIRYLEERGRGAQPFFLALSWGPPHCPYRVVPQRFLDLYPPESIRLLPNAPPHANREIIAGYYAHVTALDECLGRLLRALDAAGLADDTIVVFTSDHGDMLFSQDKGWKTKPWRESVGIPLLLRWPGHIPVGRVSGEPISLVDLMPSLLALADLPVPAEVEGEDLSAHIRGAKSTTQDSVFINYPVCPTAFHHRAWRGVVTRTHTYARFAESPWVLYDDAADPFQLANLAASPAHAALRDELEVELQRWLRRCRDSFEPSDVVAARLYPGHVNSVMPCYYNETVRQGIAHRGGRPA